MRITLILLILCCAVPVFAFDGDKVSGTCEQCPYNAGCSVSFPAADGCNTMTCDAWCENGKWKTNGQCRATLLNCWKAYEFTPGEPRTK